MLGANLTTVHCEVPRVSVLQAGKPGSPSPMALNGLLHIVSPVSVSAQPDGPVSEVLGEG